MLHSRAGRASSGRLETDLGEARRDGFARLAGFHFHVLGGDTDIDLGAHIQFGEDAGEELLAGFEGGSGILPLSWLHHIWICSNRRGSGAKIQQSGCCVWPIMGSMAVHSES